MSGNIQGNSNLQVIEAITQFVGGTQAVWNSIAVPVPAGMVVYALDTTAVKMGDGQTLYANLPVLFTISSIVSLTNLVNTLNTSTQGMSTTVSGLETEYAALEAAVTALQTAVSTLGGTTYVSTAGNVTVTSGEYFIGIANQVPAITTITMPAEPVENEKHFVKDVLGVAQSYNIIINGNGNNIDGAATYVMNTNFAGVFLFWNGTTWSLGHLRQKSNTFVVTGNPNGQLAGNASTAGSPPDFAWDGSNIWICTTSGSTTTAVWSMQTTQNLMTPVKNLGTVSSGTVNVLRSNAPVQQLIAGGPLTLTIGGFIAGYNDLVLELTNGGSTTITWPSNINWVTSTGAVTNSFSAYGVQLQSAGTDFIAFWTPDGGTTIFAKVIR
jgi:hypothetical protein